jgi:RimJ/RimL family protein N-acetyltransferase
MRDPEAFLAAFAAGRRPGLDADLVDLEEGTAKLGYRVAQQVTGRGVATATVQELCRLAAWVACR